MEEEDLGHYRDQPDRLIEEYKKLKTAKKKAEQFAVEAKQSAQKVDYWSRPFLSIENWLLYSEAL